MVTKLQNPFSATSFQSLLTRARLLAWAVERTVAMRAFRFGGELVERCRRHVVFIPSADARRATTRSVLFETGHLSTPRQCNVQRLNNTSSPSV